jgi:hypothetical protein
MQTVLEYKNKIKCLYCGAVLESKYRHDFQQCKCENKTFVDRGDHYQRIGAVNLDLIEIIHKETQ